MILGVDAANWPFPLGWLYVEVLGNLIASVIWALPTGVLFYRKLTCDKRHCWRLHRIPVQGTTYHSCRKHNTAEHHNDLRARHSRLHPHAHATHA